MEEPKSNENFENSRFILLPEEMLRKILSHVDSYGILSFCTAYSCEYIIKGQRIKTLDFYKSYKLSDIPDAVGSMLSLEFVTTLNVNCLYWISAEKLRAFIQQLRNLQTLYAIQTDLSLCRRDLHMYASLTKLEKLGISMKTTDQFNHLPFSTLTKLYVHSTYRHYMNGETDRVWTAFSRVANVWIEVEDPLLNTPQVIGLFAALDERTKLFYQINSPKILEDYYAASQSRYYSNARHRQSQVYCSEKFNQETLTTSGNNVWGILENLEFRVPFNPEDARRLFVKESTYDDILFQELNFSHTNECPLEGRKEVKKILKSKNAGCLKRLSVMSCLFQSTRANLQNVVFPDEFDGFPKNKRGIERSIKSVKKMFRNFLELTHLEINICNFIPSQKTIQGYDQIPLFENLESLSMVLPALVNGRFLIEVAKKCKKLQVLKVVSDVKNRRLNHSICAAIPNATALKDFRYKSFHFDVNTLLSQLCLMEFKTLERIVLICKQTGEFSYYPFNDFLKKNPQLVFLYFVLNDGSEVAAKYAQQRLDTYAKSHPAKVFLIETTKTYIKEDFFFPDVHYNEMVSLKDEVATIRVLEQFQSF